MEAEVVEGRADSGLSPQAADRQPPPPPPRLESGGRPNDLRTHRDETNEQAAPIRAKNCAGRGESVAVQRQKEMRVKGRNKHANRQWEAGKGVAGQIKKGKWNHGTRKGGGRRQQGDGGREPGKRHVANTRGEADPGSGGGSKEGKSKSSRESKAGGRGKVERGKKKEGGQV